ncbi:hypothetical protein ACS0TY_007193 [Phlomoides rotata]
MTGKENKAKEYRNEAAEQSTTSNMKAKKTEIKNIARKKTNNLLLCIMDLENEIKDLQLKEKQVQKDEEIVKLRKWKNMYLFCNM